MPAEPLSTVDVPLDAAWIAEMLRQRFAAGVVTRGALREASSSPANPGVTRMTREQLLDLGASPPPLAFPRWT